MKTTINLEGWQEQDTKQGKKYGKFNTSQGVMGCFDSKTIEELVKNIGSDVEVDVVENNGFKNIKKFYGTGVKEEKVVKDKESKEPAYTKDLNSTIQVWTGLITGLEIKPEEAMDMAVKLVKQAREGLK